MNEVYAAQIATEWNVPAYGSGYVTMFDVDSVYLTRYPVQNVGGAIHNELWVPAEELEEFNTHIVVTIAIVAKFEASAQQTAH